MDKMKEVDWVLFLIFIGNIPAIVVLYFFGLEPIVGA